MDISLPPDLAEFVSAKLAAGQFASADEVTIAALRYYRDAETQDLERLRTMLREADEQIDRGEFIELADSAAIHEYFEDVKRRGPDSLAKQRGDS